MAVFEIAEKLTLNLEGKYSDRKADAGGKTMYGITERTARENGYMGDMKNLTLEEANRIYKTAYWDRLKLSDVEDQDIANEIFDTAVNCGKTFAAVTVQRVLNAFNRYGNDWKDITIDGRIGPITIKILNKAIKKRKDNLLKGLNVVQGNKYVELAENPNRRDELNINGWFANRIGLNMGNSDRPSTQIIENVSLWQAVKKHIFKK